MLGQRNDQKESKRSDGEEHDFDDHRGQVGQRGSLAVLLEDWEKQNSLPHIHAGVQEDQKGARDQKGLTGADRREKVGAADQ